MLKFLKTCLHALECGLAVGVLRSALRGGDGYAGGTMNQAHARFDFIAMLPARFVEQTPPVQIILSNWLQMSCGKRPSLTSVVG